MFQFVSIALHPQGKGTLRTVGPHTPFKSENPNENKSP